MEKLEFKGTKNEWFIDQEESHRMTNGVYCNVISTANTIDIADVYGDDEESQANAKLIASAPLLLKEHETDLDVLNKWVEKFNGVFGVGSDMSQELKDMINAKKQAIEKALK